VRVVGDVSRVKEACESAGLTDKGNVARSAAVGSVLYVVDRDVNAGIVRCHSPLHGDLWFALGALCETRASKDIADAFEGSLPSLQSCSNQGLDFDSFVELADLFRVVRNVWDRMKAGFSDLEIKRFRDIFAKFDSDGSGDIDDKEIMILLANIGIECKTKANQLAIGERLEKARKLASEAGVQSPDGPKVYSFWDFMQLMRIERTKRDREYEDMVQETSSNLNFDSTEVAQFREIFIHWARQQGGWDAAEPVRIDKTVEDLIGDGLEQSISKISLIKLLQSLGCTLQTKDEPTLTEKIKDVGTNRDGQLNFVGFLQMMRWLLDSNFGGINKATANLSRKESLVSARPW